MSNACREFDICHLHELQGNSIPITIRDCVISAIVVNVLRLLGLPCEQDCKVPDHPAQPKTISSISVNFSKYSRNLQEYAGIGRFCAGNLQESAGSQRKRRAARAPRPRPALRANIEKSLVFLRFLRGAASCGSGRPRPCPSWPAGAGGAERRSYTTLSRAACPSRKH